MSISQMGLIYNLELCSEGKCLLKERIKDKSHVMSSPEEVWKQHIRQENQQVFRLCLLWGHVWTLICKRTAWIMKSVELCFLCSERFKNCVFKCSFESYLSFQDLLRSTLFHEILMLPDICVDFCFFWLLVHILLCTISMCEIITPKEQRK